MIGCHFTRGNFWNEICFKIINAIAVNAVVDLPHWSRCFMRESCSRSLQGLEGIAQHERLESFNMEGNTPLGRLHYA